LQRSHGVQRLPRAPKHAARHCGRWAQLGAAEGPARGVEACERMRESEHNASAPDTAALESTQRTRLQFRISTPRLNLGVEAVGSMV